MKEAWIESSSRWIAFFESDIPPAEGGTDMVSSYPLYLNKCR